jgi:hypothetical protein
MCVCVCMYVFVHLHVIQFSNVETGHVNICVLNAYICCAHIMHVMHLCVFLYVCMLRTYYACMYVCMCIFDVHVSCMYVFVYVRTWLCVPVYACMYDSCTYVVCTCMYTCVCVCVYVCLCVHV